MTHAETYMREAMAICNEFIVRDGEIERMAKMLSQVEGRVYMVGLGGSLANCIHMAADLRRLCDIDAEAPDNIAELTARANDQGMRDLFADHILCIGEKDALFVLSVGGGTDDVSLAIANAVHYAKESEALVFGIVGPNGGATARLGDCVIRIPVDNPKHITPHTEAFQAVIWHCLVSHPLLQKRPTKW
jgi:D-sedoheptulose 7-phosphate isomerase